MNKTKTTQSKYKSNQDRAEKVAIEHSMQWQPPLRRRLDKNGEVESVTIRVRIHNGESEHDFQAKFLPGQYSSLQICAAIAAKERISPKESTLFSLWVIGRDLGNCV